MSTTTNTNGKTGKTGKRARRARRAAGDIHADALESDASPVDMDAFRHALARRINRFVADRRRAWRDCREPACRRQRGCRAPHIHCSNAPPPPPDPDGCHAARMMTRMQRMLHDIAERHGEKV